MFFFLFSEQFENKLSFRAMINVCFQFIFHVNDVDIEMLGTWGPSLEARWMLKQVSPELSHWPDVSFTIKQLAKIPFSGNLSAFCIFVWLCVLIQFHSI